MKNCIVSIQDQKGTTVTAPTVYPVSFLSGKYFQFLIEETLRQNYILIINPIKSYDDDNKETESLDGNN